MCVHDSFVVALNANKENFWIMKRVLMVTLLDMYACVVMRVRSYISLEYRENSSVIEVDMGE